MSNQNEKQKIFGRFHEIILLLIGFILTTIVGGFLGSYFQNRSWDYQNAISLKESEKTEATKVFNEISRLLDKRLFRIRQVIWALKDNNDEIEKKLDDYRKVQFKWNDNLNRNLSLIQRYFGGDLRHKLETRIYTDFVLLGEKIEKFFNNSKLETSTAFLNEIESETDNLNREIYDFNIKLISLIQKGNVGIFNTNISENIDLSTDSPFIKDYLSNKKPTQTFISNNRPSIKPGRLNELLLILDLGGTSMNSITGISSKFIRNIPSLKSKLKISVATYSCDSAQKSYPAVSTQLLSNLSEDYLNISRKLEGAKPVPIHGDYVSVECPLNIIADSINRITWSDKGNKMAILILVSDVRKYAEKSDYILKKLIDLTKNENIEINIISPLKEYDSKTNSTFQRLGKFYLPKSLNKFENQLKDIITQWLK